MGLECTLDREQKPGHQTDRLQYMWGFPCFLLSFASLESNTTRVARVLIYEGDNEDEFSKFALDTQVCHQIYIGNTLLQLY